MHAVRPETSLGTSGFSLLELLVALLVLSVGLLGLASLQATTMRFNHSAYLRAQATSLAYDLVDRMRANRDQALQGSYDLADFPEPLPVCGAVAGTSVAELDVSGWQSAVACSLPGGVGRIARDEELFMIAIRWDAGGSRDDPAGFEFSTRL